VSKETEGGSIKEALEGAAQIIPIMERNPKGTKFLFCFFITGSLVYIIVLFLQKPSVKNLSLPVTNSDGMIKKLPESNGRNHYDINGN
jgi:hypothetical protein